MVDQQADVCEGQCGGRALALAASTLYIRSFLQPLIS